jgi:hypothetical protein
MSEEQRSDVCQGKEWLWLSLLILLGFVLQSIALGRTEGLWCDECWSYYMATQPGINAVLERLQEEDMHAPFYFILLHFWIKLFGNHDTTLRLLSVVMAVLLLPVLYGIGRELGNRQSGIFAAGLTAVNSLLIHYAQEVRFYSASILFSGLTIWLLLRFKKNPSLGTCAGLVAAQTALAYTYTLGIFFVFCEVVICTLFFYRQGRAYWRRWLAVHVCTGMLFLPYLLIFFHQYQANAKANAIIPAASWFYFDASFSLCLAQNYFSSVLINLYNNGPYHEIFWQLWQHSPTMIVVLLILPVLLCCLSLFKTIALRDWGAMLLALGFSFVLAQMVAASLGKFSVITRHTILVLPCFLGGVGYGLAHLQRKGLACFVFLLAANMYAILFTPYSIWHAARPEGIKPIAEVLRKYQFGSGDILVMPYGPYFFVSLQKYYTLDNKVFFCDDVGAQKNWGYVFPPELLRELNARTASDILRDYLGEPGFSLLLEQYVKDKLIDRLPPGRYVAMVVKSSWQEEEKCLPEVVADQHVYSQLPLRAMLATKIISDMVRIHRQYLHYAGNVPAGGWNVMFFRK